MKRDFEDILLNLKESIADYKYYVDFEKIKKNVEKLKIELNILNSLIGSNNIVEEFKNVISQYPNTLKAIPMLLAVRGTKIKIIDDGFIEFDFSKLNQSVDKYVRLMSESGLFDMLEKNQIKDLVDYVTGVEVGLDSNARKNRTGKAMETVVENYFKSAEIKYYTQLNKAKIKDIFDIDLTNITLKDETGKEADKKFDLIFEKFGIVYLVETNFYGGGGSKLNETARSYKELAYQLKRYNNVKFVWITDGVGWNTVKKGLKETYDELEHFYTLKDLEDGKIFSNFTKDKRR